MNGVAIVPLSQSEARQLTDRIRSAVDTLWSLLLEAHERKAWKALGYQTWEAYVRGEFDMSRRSSYRLLDQGRVARAIAEASGFVPDLAQNTHDDVQAIKRDLPEVTEEIRARVEQGADPVQTTYEVIEAKRAERKAVHQSDDNDWLPEGDEPESEPEAPPAPEASNVTPFPQPEPEPEKPPVPASEADGLRAEIEELRDRLSELASEYEETLAENESLAKVLDASDQVATALAEAKKYREINRVLEERIRGLMNEKNEAVRMAKSWQRKAEKALKAG